MPKKFTQEQYIELVKKIHNNKYDYSKINYLGSHSKIKIICKIHGEFEQYANDHKKGHGCNQCGIIKLSSLKTYSNEKFIDLCNKIHNYEYDYSLTNYVNHNTKVDIICKKHGVFSQFAYNHLVGVKCRLCGYDKQKNTIITNGNVSTDTWNYSDWEKRSLVSKNFTGFKVYIIECWNDTERFYKIGKTFRNIDDRFKNCLPYNWKPINVINGESLYISELETKLKKINKINKYTPKIKFGGAYECFSKIDFGEINLI